MTWLLVAYFLWLPTPLNDAPSVQQIDSEWWAVPIPLSLLDDASVRKKLYSGLTTTFELEATFKPAQSRSYFAVLQVRYEIWEEVFIINRLEADGRAQQQSFATLEETAAWLADDPLKIAPVASGNSMTVRVRLIPFSRGEEQIAEDWFARVLRVPDAVTTGQSDRTTDRSLDDRQDGGGIFEVLMSKSIRRKSIRTVRWQYRLDGGS